MYLEGLTEKGSVVENAGVIEMSSRLDVMGRSDEVGEAEDDYNGEMSANSRHSSINWRRLTAVAPGTTILFLRAATLAGSPLPTNATADS